MRTRNRNGAVSAALLLVLAFASRPMHAQILYGSLIGNVNDTSSAAVPGASVRITQVESNESRTVRTNDSGIYSVPSIPAGIYTVEIRKDGFQAATRKDVAVNNNSAVRVDFVLQVGAVSETVQVSAEAVALQTDGADVRAEITSKTLEDVPLPPGRNFQNMLITVPGITPP